MYQNNKSVFPQATKKTTFEISVKNYVEREGNAMIVFFYKKRLGRLSGPGLTLASRLQIRCLAKDCISENAGYAQSEEGGDYSVEELKRCMEQ